MIQALLAYLIVAVATAWIFWSMILPVRLRAALRRRLGLQTAVCRMQSRAGGCRGCDRSGCPLRR
jgi:hypothetical protein